VIGRVRGIDALGVRRPRGPAQPVGLIAHRAPARRGLGDQRAIGVEGVIGLIAAPVYGEGLARQTVGIVVEIGPHRPAARGLGEVGVVVIGQRRAGRARGVVDGADPAERVIDIIDARRRGQRPAGRARRLAPRQRRDLIGGIVEIQRGAGRRYLYGSNSGIDWLNVSPLAPNTPL